MKTIIMVNPVMEAAGSKFPKVEVTAEEAEGVCRELEGRLPTPEEYDRLFSINAWPHLIYEWTSTNTKDMKRVVKGGCWDYTPVQGRRANYSILAPAGRYGRVGFRCVKEIADDAPVPEGWTEL